MSNFRGVQIEILAVLRLPRGCHVFPRIVTIISTELKLISVDFVLGGRQNWKYNSDFQKVQISFSIPISSEVEQLCMHVRMDMSPSQG